VIAPSFASRHPRAGRRCLALIATAVALVACEPRAAAAHAQPYSFLDLRLESGGLEGTYTAHAFDLAHEIGLAAPDTLLDSVQAVLHAPRLRSILAPRVILVADGDTLQPSWHGGVPAPAQGGMTFAFDARWSRLPARLEIEARPFPYDAQHEVYVNLYEGGALRHQGLFDSRNARHVHYAGGRQGTLAVIRTFIASGIHHILIGPDHILFVLGLLLPGGTVLGLIRIVTAFTVAHSITLALATLRVVDPGSWVEPVIALSIVFVGLDNLRMLRGGADRRAWLAFAFGLVHGFGFASVLRDFGLPQQALAWSLVSFNVGVEIGQAAIVVVAAPLLAWARSRIPATGRLVAVATVLVALAGAVWFVERVTFAAR
jgi:hypothetical protein